MAWIAAQLVYVLLISCFFFPPERFIQDADVFFVLFASKTAGMMAC
jgi:hypothetical protein